MGLLAARAGGLTRRADPADKHLENLPTLMAVVLEQRQASDLHLAAGHPAGPRGSPSGPEVLVAILLIRPQTGKNIADYP